MRVKTTTEIKDFDILSALGIEEGKQSGFALKVFTSITCGSNSNFVFGAAKSTPIKYTTEQNDSFK